MKQIEAWLVRVTAIFFVLEWCRWLTRYSLRDSSVVGLGAAAGACWVLCVAPHSFTRAFTRAFTRGVHHKLSRFNRKTLRVVEVVMAMVLGVCIVVALFYFQWIPFQWMRLMDLISIPRRGQWYDSVAFESSPFLYRGPSLGPVGTLGLAGILGSGLFWRIGDLSIRRNVTVVVLGLLLGAPGGLPIPVLLFLGWLSIVARAWLFGQSQRWIERVVSRYQNRSRVDEQQQESVG